MQVVSNQYKQEMKQAYRNHSYIRVTIGMINQQAQSSAYVPFSDNYTYYSNLIMPFNDYKVTELYATCDKDYTQVDSRMYFLPRNRQDVVLNNGVVSKNILGNIEIYFPEPYSIKGLTIDFGKAYPVDFSIASNNNIVEIAGNSKQEFVTEEIFPEATYIKIIPRRMSNGQSRLRIHNIKMGLGLYYDNKKIQSANKKEIISPISSELQSIDFSLTLENKDRLFDIENEDSSINFFEAGQPIELWYGYELNNGEIEWIQGASLLLKDWAADDNTVSFNATDIFDTMSNIYYKGLYREEGISLYDLALDVFRDADIDSRTYWIDSYLKNIIVYNAMPAVSHKEALQIISNAGRCVLFQGRNGNIYLKSSFIPKMFANSPNETYYSHANRLLDKTIKDSYAQAVKNYSKANTTQYFLPKRNTKLEYLNTGYISEAIANEKGEFQSNPIVEILLEATYKCFGLTLEFGLNNPVEMVIHTYNDGSLLENYYVNNMEQLTIINHEFPEFDQFEIEFLKGVPHNRVVLNNIIFGESTDYRLEYGSELTKTPTGKQLEKVKELQVIQTLYYQNPEKKELVKEKVIIDKDNRQHTFYLNNACYDYLCTIDTQEIAIIEYSCYYVKIQIPEDITGEKEIILSGREYITNQVKNTRALNNSGQIKTWKNPLVSTKEQASDLCEWIGDYLKSDREYQITYRGEPRIDANDIVFLENKYIDNMLIRIFEHNLNFNGALSGTIKGRRDLSVDTAQNRLVTK